MSKHWADALWDVARVGGETACIAGHFATCSPENDWEVSPCPKNLKCYAVPGAGKADPVCPGFSTFNCSETVLTHHSAFRALCVLHRTTLPPGSRTQAQLAESTVMTPPMTLTRMEEVEAMNRALPPPPPRMYRVLPPLLQLVPVPRHPQTSQSSTSQSGVTSRVFCRLPSPLSRPPPRSPRLQPHQISRTIPSTARP